MLKVNTRLKRSQLIHILHGRMEKKDQGENQLNGVAGYDARYELYSGEGKAVNGMRYLASEWLRVGPNYTGFLKFSANFKKIYLKCPHKLHL